MANKIVSLSVRGISPLLMHKFPMFQTPGIDKAPPEEQAEISAYRVTGTGELYIPGNNMQRALVSSATYSKGKGRASLQKIVAACVFVSPQYLLLGTDKYELDSQSVVIPSTKGRIIRIRPRLDEWQVSFEIEYDHTLLTEAQLRQIVDDAGSRVGILDFRPERKGFYGRFMVINWNLK